MLQHLATSEIPPSSVVSKLQPTKEELNDFFKRCATRTTMLIIFSTEDDPAFFESFSKAFSIDIQSKMWLLWITHMCEYLMKITPLQQKHLEELTWSQSKSPALEGLYSFMLLPSSAHQPWSSYILSVTQHSSNDVWVWQWNGSYYYYYSKCKPCIANWKTHMQLWMIWHCTDTSLPKHSI